jgi:prepilin-type N-terminal cleavage/methylation domain-containing protein
MKCRSASKIVNSSSTRSGVTLLEILLVVAIMAFLSALALPGFDRIFAAQRIDKSAEIVRAEMGRARVQAIRTGKVFAFVYNEGRSELAVRQFDQLVQAGTVEHFRQGGTGPQGGMGQSLASDPRDGNMDYSNERLPRGVRFLTGQTVSDIRSQYESDAAGGSAGQLKPILFYPDGSSQDAQIILANERGDAVRIVLRGLTGSTRVVRMSQ